MVSLDGVGDVVIGGLIDIDVIGLSKKKVFVFRNGIVFVFRIVFVFYNILVLLVSSGFYFLLRVDFLISYGNYWLIGWKLG